MANSPLNTHRTIRKRRHLSESNKDIQHSLIVWIILSTRKVG